MKPNEIERWALRQQRRFGAAPADTGAGYLDEGTQAGTKIYMRRLNDGYDELNAAAVKIQAEHPPQSDAAWQYLNRWAMTFAAWKKFYADTIDDWLITTDDKEEAEDFGGRLDKARGGFKAALGQAPPGEPVPGPKAPSPEATPASALSSAVDLLKWGVLGFLVFKGVELLSSRSKKEAT